MGFTIPTWVLEGTVSAEGIGSVIVVVVGGSDNGADGTSCGGGTIGSSDDVAGFGKSLEFVFVLSIVEEDGGASAGTGVGSESVIRIVCYTV